MLKGLVNHSKTFKGLYSNRHTAILRSVPNDNAILQNHKTLSSRCVRASGYDTGWIYSNLQPSSGTTRVGVYDWFGTGQKDMIYPDESGQMNVIEYSQFPRFEDLPLYQPPF